MSPDRLIDALSTTPALAEVFSDASVLRAMLEFEAALALVQARAGLIPADAAETIAAIARGAAIDAAAVARGARAAATPSIPLVAALTRLVAARDAASAAFVHWGATSQDVADTALVILLARARPLLLEQHRTLAAALRRLSDAHASTVMLGRTLLQPATPTTFGLKCAVWHSVAADGWSRLDRALEEAATVQLGGAVGTLAALGDRGPAVASALADELGLAPSLPWHTERGRLAAVAAACAILAGGLAKIARDLALLMQAEVAEVAAPGGGSSTMPHKRNPAGCAVALAAAARVPGLAAGVLSGAVHEHERALGGWQLEWPAMSDTVQTTGAALTAVAETVAGLEVFPARMRANLDATNGVIFAERAVLLLRASVGRDAAERIVAGALRQAQPGRLTFSQALARDADAVRALGAGPISRLDRPEDYLGAAESIRQQLLSRP